MSSHTAIPYNFSQAFDTSAGGNYCGALHNYLQERKEAHLLSWSEVLSTPPNPVRWTVHCKVGGEVMGVGFGVQKAVARQAAAKQACEALYKNSK